MDFRYLNLLSKEYPNVDSVSEEIINLSAIKSLPKGTEYFFSDLHGEHEAFIHILRSASGIIRTKIDAAFEQSVSERERNVLSSLIYDPEYELRQIKERIDNYDDWCKITIYRLVKVCKAVSSKYTRLKVRNRIPEGFQYIIEELLHTDDIENKTSYYNSIINSIVEINMADRFIIAMCILIGRLAIDRLHIIGDIYDRGPHADEIMEELMRIHDVDIQWGNHDISWMGAVTGNLALVANVIRLGISYNNFDLLEDGYGINLRALSVFAAKVYQNDHCELFIPHILDDNKYDPVDISLAAKMHKAMAVIQFKLEGQLIRRHPEYGMDDRILIDKINYDKESVMCYGKEYSLKDSIFPTVDPANPLELTADEEELMNTIAFSFRHSHRLNKHVKFLYSNGSMYKCVNSNLLYHGCIPMDDNGNFMEVKHGDKRYSGKEYLDFIDEQVRKAYFCEYNSDEQINARDYLWYLWCGPNSPLFGKDRMVTFERYFILDPDTHKENMNSYYRLIDEKSICEKILLEFNMNIKKSHIINGHVPVRIKQGEKPVKGGGLLFMIDGGISKAYHAQTGIGGYTFIFNSKYLALAEHKPYVFAENDEETESAPTVKIVELMKNRVLVSDTDEGMEIERKINDLKQLLEAYRTGLIKENQKHNYIF